MVSIYLIRIICIWNCYGIKTMWPEINQILCIISKWFFILFTHEWCGQCCQLSKTHTLSKFYLKLYGMCTSNLWFRQLSNLCTVISFLCNVLYIFSKKIQIWDFLYKFHIVLDSSWEYFIIVLFECTILEITVTYTSIIH